jgi:hypothetical protein
MTLLVDALAVYRLARLIIEDEITASLREPLTDWLAEHEHHQVLYLISCYWCLGFWLAAAATLARGRWPRVWSSTAYALAVSAAVGLIHETASAEQ